LEREAQGGGLRPLPILLARVDNRLVHGQVLEAWVPALGADGVLAVDRPASRDSLQRRIIEGLGRDGRLEVRVCDPEGAAEFLRDAWPQKRVLVLFAGIPQALEARRAGVSFDLLNLGNLHPREGSCQIAPSVHLTDEDWDCLEVLSAEGVRVEIQAVPRDRRLDLSAILGERRRS
jgi:mannose/fructose/N-acetylgalactosamine-specific phosphotransferase system component IIB